MLLVCSSSWPQCMLLITLIFITPSCFFYYNSQKNHPFVCVGYPFDKIHDKFGFCRVTFKRVIANKSTEKFSCVPYPMTLLNCLLSAWYLSPSLLYSESTVFHFILHHPHINMIGKRDIIFSTFS